MTNTSLNDAFSGFSGDSERSDVAIVGAGVVGCAVARSFAIRGWSTVLIDRADDVLEGVSKGNSALLHSGFDEPLDSKELQMVQSGYAQYKRIHRRMNLPLDMAGALVVAWSEDDERKLPEILAHAKSTNTAATLLSRSALLAREPSLASHARAAISIPDEALIDPWSAPLGYVRQAMLHGAILLTGTQVTALERQPSHWKINTNRGPLAARLVINCAGLFGDAIEALAGFPPSFRIIPRKGQFLVYDKPASDLVTSIILPVPTDRTKGVLATRTVFGNLLVGPTAEDQEDRTRAACDADALRRLMSAGEAMLPGLKGQTITATYAGLRPASEHRDYVLRVDLEKGWITVGGIRSTGLSAALGLGEWAAEQGTQILGQSRAAPPDDALDWPVMPNLAEAGTRPYQAAGRSQIVCHCEWVTEAEITAALTTAPMAGTLGGLRRRTRVMMGRCQGFGCAAAVARLAPELFFAGQGDA